jgi:hypothetical protein
MPLHTKSISICAALTWLLVCVLGSRGADEGEAQAEVKAVGGLCIRLQLPAAEKGKKLPARCEVVLENVGDNDLNVNLGCSLANGQSHHPTALRLLALSEGAKPRTLIYSIRVAGRLDQFVVPLPAGSTYTLPIAFEKFTDSESGEPVDLTAKDYRIVAEFVGEAVTTTNGDARTLALMPYWQGKVLSSEVQLPFAKKSSDQ